MFHDDLISLNSERKLIMKFYPCKKSSYRAFGYCTVAMWLATCTTGYSTNTNISTIFWYTICMVFYNFCTNVCVCTVASSTCGLLHTVIFPSLPSLPEWCSVWPAYRSYWNGLHISHREAWSLCVHSDSDTNVSVYILWNGSSTSLLCTCSHSLSCGKSINISMHVCVWMKCFYFDDVNKMT